jgi:polyisoprenyl-teichoic acid--peptidoglycan teichoic acid transferase
LAAILGVCIGLVVTDVKRQSELKTESVKIANEIQQIPQNVSNTITQAVPTVSQRTNILLMGVDSNGRNTQRFLNTRSDTMMLMSVDPASKTVNIVSIPRDSRVKIADNHGVDKINSAHALGGPELAMATVKEDFCVPVDHYVVIDVQGLKKAFQVLGPTDVLVEKRMRYVDHAAGLRVNLDPGLHTLTPEQMEEYVRFRHDAKGDIGRIDRQQWFMRALTKKLKEPQVVLKLPELFKLANEYVQTDLSIEDMARLANFGKDIRPDQIQTATLPGRAAMIKGGSYWIPDAFGSAIVFNRLLGTSLNASEAGLGVATDQAEGDEAIAATTDVMDVARPNDPVSVTLKYPKGTDTSAKRVEQALLKLGYTVKLKFRGADADCAHEQIVENSFRADNDLAKKLRDQLPVISSWPIVMNLDQHAPSDFTLVISPSSAATIIDSLKTEEADASTKKSSSI